MQSPDPVREAAAYQEFLLGLLGNDDPAAVQSETPLALRGILLDAGPDVRTRPEPEEWSVVEVTGHLLDAEMVCSARYRWILAHDAPSLIGYDEGAWVARLRHAEDDPDLLAATFEALRRANLELWRRTPDEERGRVGMHEERGPESYELSFRLIAGHDRLHLDQARGTLAAARR